MDALAIKAEPQQGIPQTRRSQSTTPQRPVSGIEFEQFLKNWAFHIAREQEKTHKLCEMSVTIHRRARALTLSDMCGRYGARRDTQGRWLDYDADLDGEIHPINIVGPAMTTNQNACLQSNSETEVASASANAKNKQAAMRWQRVADYFERSGWDETERAFIFDAVQADGTVLKYIRAEVVDKQAVPNVKKRNMGLAVYKCEQCGPGLMQTDDAEEGMQEMPCPTCQQPTNAMVTPLEGYNLDEAEVPIYKITDETIPFYNFTIDTYGAKIKGIQGAKWLQIQNLVDRIDLETEYPGKVFLGPMNWCYPLRCDYALANGSWDYLNRSDHRGDFPEFQKFEKRSIYLHETAYSNWVSPSDYEFVNAKGKKIISIKTGQTITEAWEAMYGENPCGLKFVWIDQRLVDIISPEEEILNFRDCYSDIHWRRESGSYLSSPNYSLVTIQDDITLLNTMNHNIIARNAVIPVYYDATVWEKADFTSEYIGSKNAALLGDDRDLSKSVVQLPVPTPSPALYQQLQFLWEIKDQVSNVTPALRGETQHGETLGAVRQQLEQSYGSLTSVLKSFAQCKNSVFIQKAKLAKKFWTVEQFQRVASMFGELWDEQDIEEMCDIDFDEDLIVTYKTGSEMPQSSTDREIRFEQGINALMPFLQAGVPIGPDKFAKILDKIDEYAGFDFDLTGLEVNDLIAQKRYLDLATICQEFKDVTFAEVEQEKQNVAAIDQMGQPITQLDLITEQIFAKSQIRFSQYEDLDQQKAFFIEQLRAETGKTNPNWVLLEMMNVMIGFIEQASMEAKMQAMMQDPQVQAQMAQQQAEQGQASDANAQDQQNQQKQLEAQQQADAQNAERDDNHRNADRAADLIKHHATLENQKEIAKAKPKEKVAA